VTLPSIDDGTRTDLDLTRLAMAARKGTLAANVSRHTTIHPFGHRGGIARKRAGIDALLAQHRQVHEHAAQNSTMDDAGMARELPKPQRLS
jgi:hypothetical protein